MSTAPTPSLGMMLYEPDEDARGDRFQMRIVTPNGQTSNIVDISLAEFRAFTALITACMERSAIMDMRKDVEARDGN